LDVEKRRQEYKITTTRAREVAEHHVPGLSEVDLDGDDRAPTAAFFFCSSGLN